MTRWAGSLCSGLVAVGFAVVTCCESGFAQAASACRRRSAPPGSELTISVMTMGVGEEVWERFGHNAILVEDRRAGSSIAYNFGMFSFRQEHFLLHFLQGRMWYWMAGYPTEEEVPRYIAARRSVWQQELNLTPAERLAIREDLERNARDENKFYRYDYYLDNCSTRIRDVIDRASAVRSTPRCRRPRAAATAFTRSA